MIKKYYKHLNSIYGFPVLNILLLSGLFANIVIGIMKYLGKINGIYFRGENSVYLILDVYFLAILLVVILSCVGLDFKNSLGAIGLIKGSGKSNKYIINKLSVIILSYIPIYIVTFINLVINKNDVGSQINQPSILELGMNSLITYIFIISLTILLIVTIRDIPKVFTIVVVYYFIEEFLWKCKLTGRLGILSHRINIYEVNNINDIIIKVAYLILALIFLIISYHKLGKIYE